MIGDKYNIEFALSYADFMRENRITELSDEMVKKWLDATIKHQQFVSTPDELMCFFKIKDTPENREWVTARKYNVTGLIKNQDDVKKVIMYHLTLVQSESSILLPPL